MTAIVKEFEKATSTCEACLYGAHEEQLIPGKVCGCVCHIEVTLDELLAAEPRAHTFISCNKCNKDFPGIFGQTNYEKHTCITREQEEAERKARQDKILRS